MNARPLLHPLLFSMAALGLPPGADAATIFHDEFTGALIDASKWDVSVVMHYEPGTPAPKYGSYGQDDALWLAVYQENIARGQAITKRTFSRQDNIVEVEVWQDETSGWQDWPISMVTHLGGFGYYNFTWHWTVQWVDSYGHDQRLYGFPLPRLAPWTKYRMRIQVDGGVLSWHLDLDDGKGYRLLHSTTDFSLPFKPPWLEPRYFERIALTSTDIGTTYYDNLVVATGDGTGSELPKEEFFDDFIYSSDDPNNPVDPDFLCFGWYAREDGGRPGPDGASWRQGYVTWKDDPNLPGNRVMLLRATTGGGASSTTQSEVGTAERFFEGTYCARIRFTDQPAALGQRQPSVQAFFMINSLAECDPSYSEIDYEYLPNDVWEPRCSGPALHMVAWEQWSDPNTEYPDCLTIKNNPQKCDSFAAWHVYCFQVVDGKVSFIVDTQDMGSSSDETYPETLMGILFQHWFTDGLVSGVSGDYTMEVDWVYHGKDVSLPSAKVLDRVDEFRAAGIQRWDSMSARPDCNNNDIPDECDIAGETSRDCNANAVPDECEADTDADGAIDACDNCPGDPNQDQADCDGDGTGDVCDPTPYADENCSDAKDNDCDALTDCDDPDCDNDPACGVGRCLPGDPDGDGDGVCNGLDDCPGTPSCATVDANGCPADGDGDGVPNGCDDCPDTAPGVEVGGNGCPSGCGSCGALEGVTMMGIVLGLMFMRQRR